MGSTLSWATVPSWAADSIDFEVVVAPSFKTDAAAGLGSAVPYPGTTVANCPTRRGQVGCSDYTKAAGSTAITEGELEVPFDARESSRPAHLHLRVHMGRKPSTLTAPCVRFASGVLSRPVCAAP